MNKEKFYFAFFCTVYFVYYMSTYREWHFLDNLNLVIHEAGHTLFMFFGDFMSILGGSLLQVLLPLIFSFYFYRSKQFFEASVLLFWVGQNLLNVSIYAGDAISMQLPLFGGDSVGHDWNNLLSMTGTLEYTKSIAEGIYFLGTMCMVIAALYSFYYSFYREPDAAGIQEL